MKSCVIYGPRNLRVEEGPTPDPGPGMVRLRTGAVGVCGSDIHYYHLGRVGDAVLREPMVPGHEIAGVVDAVGPDVSGLRVGDRVIVNPSNECGVCAWCREGRQNLCPDLKYYGSAARMPHVQGVMREFPLVQARQCIPVDAAVPMAQAACVEPLAIALHAVRRAGDMLGRRVFVCGAGPVGCLIAAVARLNGAGEVIISDLEGFPLERARELGADVTINARDEAALERLNGSCDVCFEASGSAPGLASCLMAARRGGDVVHVGFQHANEVPYPVNAAVIRKELSVHGSLRAYQEFPLAARLVGNGRIRLEPLITAVMPLEDAAAAIDLAADKTCSLKVVLAGPAIGD